MRLIKHQWLASGSVYGHRKITKDLRDLGERCISHCVHRLMRTEGLRAQVGYGRKPRFHGGAECMAASNLLDRQFEVTTPDTVWASDFTFIRTHEGWMYLAVVIDLFSRQVVGWAMLKRERIKRRIYPTKDAARADAFDYIEMLYNPKRRHGSTGDLSPVEFERRYAQRGS